MLLLNVSSSVFTTIVLERSRVSSGVLSTAAEQFRPLKEDRVRTLSPSKLSSRFQVRMYLAEAYAMRGRVDEAINVLETGEFVSSKEFYTGQSSVSGAVSQELSSREVFRLNVATLYFL